MEVSDETRMIDIRGRRCRFVWDMTALADPRGDVRSLQSNFLYFHAVFGRKWPNDRFSHSPLELAPSLDNPGSAT